MCFVKIFLGISEIRAEMAKQLFFKKQFHLFGCVGSSLPGRLFSEFAVSWGPVSSCGVQLLIALASLAVDHGL